MGRKSKKEGIYVYVLEQDMTTHPSILACRIPWTEEPGIQSMGSPRVRHDLGDLARTHVYM